ncbi:unnamed protein product [Symbiodinium natans]|uniref:Uncharacterized protein n=1 Tax=Symbiodinium natans TaxID=878477 RepID=A0A812QWI8_9DINO|nr:unnamed protein product [Symbiodinium natans]
MVACHRSAEAVGIWNDVRSDPAHNCAEMLSRAGHVGLNLHLSLVIEDAVLMSAQEVALAWDRCAFHGVAFAHTFLSSWYLQLTQIEQTSRYSDSHWLRVGACIPDACLGYFAPLALPRILEQRMVANTGNPASLPSARPCSSDSPRNSQEAEAICRQQIADEMRDPACISERCKWKYLSQKLQMEGLFGAQVRSIASDIDADLSPEADALALRDDVAARHYLTCRQIGGQFFGAAFAARDGDFDLGVCAPAACPASAIRWWTAQTLEHWRPGVSVSAQSINVTELAHISEVDLQWIIAGVGRSGTTSLAAWLRTHPQLELLTDPADTCLEGGLGYLFRRSYMHHLVPRTSLLEPVDEPRLTGSGKRVLRGIKDWSLLQLARGRRVLGQLKVRVLIIVKARYLFRCCE